MSQTDPQHPGGPAGMTSCGQSKQIFIGASCPVLFVTIASVFFAVPCVQRLYFIPVKY